MKLADQRCRNSDHEAGEMNHVFSNHVPPLSVVNEFETY